MTYNIEKFERVRMAYPGTESQVYLDTPTTGLISKNSYIAMKNKLDKRHYSGVTISEYWADWDKADKLRGLFACMINASAEEIFYGTNCSDMINTFVSNIDIPKNANVIIPEISFPSTRNSWLNRSKDGLDVRFVKNTDGIVSTEKIIESIDPNTFAISICGVEHSTGYKYDLELLGKVCREQNIYFIVDTTQCLGAMPIDVQKYNIDVMVSSTYKWMNNLFGLGVGYMRKDLVAKILPKHFGWGGIKDRIKDFNNLELTQNDGAQRFETGGLNWIGLKGLEETVKTYLYLGREETENYILDLVDLFYNGMSQAKNAKIQPALAPQNRSSVIYIEVPEHISLTEKDFLSKGLRVNLSKNKIRIGIHLYNNKADVVAITDFFKAL